MIIKRLSINENAKRKLRNRLMNEKIRDAYRKKRQQQMINLKIWRQCKRIIKEHLLQVYMVIW